MTFHAFGLNHERAPVVLREAFALDAERRGRLLAALRLSAEAEVVLVSTCNRTEALLYGSDLDVLAVQDALARAAGVPWPGQTAFALTDEAALTHALELAAGLRSLVLGDAQVLAQLKDAYQAATDAERVGPALHRLMHAAFRAAKRVRTETGLGRGAATVSAAAVAAARQHAGGSLDGRRVLLLGAGEMGVAALRALASDRLADLAVANRSPARAREAAARAGARIVAWQARAAAADAADVILVATGAPEPVLRAAALAPRPARPALVVDVAVPRNVARDVDAVPGYAVLDLDGLDRRVDAADEGRRAAAAPARALCAEARDEFVTWFFHQQALQPTIRALRETFDAIAHEELARHAHRFSDADREDVERLMRSVLQKVLAVPVVSLKGHAPDSFDFVAGVKALGRIFARPGCEDAGPAETAPLPFTEAVAAPAPLRVWASEASVPAAASPPEICPFHAQAPVQGPTHADRDARV